MGILSVSATGWLFYHNEQLGGYFIIISTVLGCTGFRERRIDLALFTICNERYNTYSYMSNFILHFIVYKDDFVRYIHSHTVCWENIARWEG